MTVGQLREHLAALPGDLEVHVDAGQGESRTASTMARYGACVVLEAELDPDETPHGGRPAGWIAPRVDLADSPEYGMVRDESPADSRVPDEWKDYAAQYGDEEAIERASVSRR